MLGRVAAVTAVAVLLTGCGRDHGVSGEQLLERVDRAYVAVPAVRLTYATFPALAPYGRIRSLLWLRNGIVAASVETVAGSVIVWPGGRRTYARVRGEQCWVEVTSNNQNLPFAQPSRRFLHASRMAIAKPEPTPTGWLLPIKFREPPSRGIGGRLRARPAYSGTYVLAVARGSYQVSTVLTRTGARWLSVRQLRNHPLLPKTTPRCIL